MQRMGFTCFFPREFQHVSTPIETQLLDDRIHFRIAHLFTVHLTFSFPSS
jgi:hypothetical protein